MCNCTSSDNKSKASTTKSGLIYTFQALKKKSIIKGRPTSSYQIKK